MSPPPIVLSLRPRFAEAIVRGSKTIEVRRSFSDRWIGARAVLYASTPVRAVVGVAAIARVERMTPGALWRTHGPRTGVTRHELETYLTGCRHAFAITLVSVERLARPIPLIELGATDTRVRPPQSYCAALPGSAWAAALESGTKRRAG